MKLFLSALTAVYSLDFYAQSFTNGSVFNYSVNDTIVSDCFQYPNGWNGTNSPPVRTYRIFKQKHFSTNQDTVFYQTKDYIIHYQACIGCQLPITQTITNFFVTALNNSAINYTLLTCIAQHDTSFVNDCGMNEHNIDQGSLSDTSFCEPNIELYRIIEALGIFHVFRSGVSSPSGMGDETKLAAYHKASQSGCGGSIGLIPTGMSEWKPEETRLIVYPNPSNGHYTIGTKMEISIVVQNLIGEDLKRMTLPAGRSLLDLTNQPQGIYFLTCKSESKIYMVKIVKE